MGAVVSQFVSQYVVSAFRRTTGPAKAGHYVLPLIVAAWIAAIPLAGRSLGEVGLLDAAERADRSAALQLLAKGANPNAPGPDGTTAIMWAASNDDLELVRALIKAGASVTLKNQLGTSALTEAAIVGSAPVIDALLKAGADPNTK